MEFRVLKYYLIVAREENITRAAELLNITQPTLSRQLQQLEEELGVRLFQRGKHHITLTEEGMLLKRRAQELVDLEDKTKAEIKKEENTVLSGTISIGSGEVKSMRLLADLMAAFHQEHPLVKFDLYSSNADHIKERIEKGLTDIGLLTEPVEVERYQFIRLSQKARWGVLVRQDSPLASFSAIRPEDLIGTPVLLAGRDSVRNELANWLGDIYDRLDIAGTYNLLYKAAILITSLHGAAFCQEHDTKYQDLVFVPLSPVLETGSVLVWKKSQIFTPATASFLDFLKNAEKA